MKNIPSLLATVPPDDLQELRKAVNSSHVNQGYEILSKYNIPDPLGVIRACLKNPSLIPQQPTETKPAASYESNQVWFNVFMGRSFRVYGPAHPTEQEVQLYTDRGSKWVSVPRPQYNLLLAGKQVDIQLWGKWDKARVTMAPKPREAG